MAGFTPKQEAAIYTRGADVLVSAAAGSGKTAVLVERIINMITSEVCPVDINRLLVVTFTEAAASEMRRRISARLSELARESPRDYNLRKQQALLTIAPISTIHSFCKKLVFEYAHMLDVDPAFKVGDQTQMLILKQEVMEDVLEEKYAEANNESFTRLVETFGSKYTDTNLRETVFKTHQFLLASPWPFERANEYAALYNGKYDSISETPWAELLNEMMITRLEAAKDEIEYALELSCEEGGPFPYGEVFESDIADLESLEEMINARGGGRRDEIAVFAFTVGRLPVIKKKDKELIDEDKKEAAQKARNKAKKIIKDDIARFYSESEKGSLIRIERAGRVIQALIDLTESFDIAFAKRKAELNILDFNDLERKALDVLYTESHALSAAALDARNSYDEVLTDEYQDSNDLQELILSAVAKPGRRFMVGDIKQSIYRFRQARPQIFNEKYERYTPFDDDKNARQIKIDLSHNFRSRANVLKTINFLFHQLMSKEVGEVVYDDNAALHSGADYPETEERVDDITEIVLLERNTSAEDEAIDELDDNECSADSLINELTKAQTEAHYVARRIKAAVYGSDSLSVYDKLEGGYRKARCGDVAILAASVKNIGNTYSEVFKMYDIPIYVNAGEGFFNNTEISTMLSMLAVTDNPKQDIPLITVLYSPVFGLTCDELVQVREVNKKALFYDCVLEYMGKHDDSVIIEKLKFFKECFDDFRNRALFTPVCDLLWYIFDKTLYYEYAGAMPGGVLRQANLRALCERAYAYEKTQMKGMRHFLLYIEKLRASGGDMAPAKIIGKNADTVRMMTIHASKGLEFPFVFLVNAEKRFRGQNADGDLLLDRDYGFGMSYIDLGYRIKYPMPPKTAIAFKAHKEDLSERLRVLYVALTRAREKLIVTAVIPSYAKEEAKWSRPAKMKQTRISKHYMLKSKCFLDWIMPAVMRHGKGYGLKYGDSALTVKTECISPDTDVYPLTPLRTEEKQATETKGAVEEVRAKFAWEYPYREATTLPSKVSVSEIKRLHQQVREGSANIMLYETKADFAPPSFEKEAPKAEHLGTVIHTVMEHLDFAREHDENSVNAIIEMLVGRSLIKRETVQHIPVNRILEFLRSALFARARASLKMYRETPFVLALTPGEFIPGAGAESNDELILTHGIIDLFFEEEDGIVIVDYKSDIIKPGGKEAVMEKYKPQLALYKKALTYTESLPVKQAYLYLFSTGEAAECEFS